MGTTTAYTAIDAIGEALGLTHGQLAKLVRVSEDVLLKARGGELHPATVQLLARHLGVSPALFTRPAESVATLLEVFRIVEPYERIRLVDKIATIRDALHRIYGTVYPPINRPFPHLDLLLEEYNRSEEASLVPFVAYVRQRLEDDYIMVFAHPLGSDDYSAVLFVPDKQTEPYSYLVVDENPAHHPITNALYQWYDVLRVLTRVRDWKLDTHWNAVYLERDMTGYDEHVNIRLAESIAVYSRYTYQHVQPSSVLALADQYRLTALVAGLLNGLSPVAVADYFRRESSKLSVADAEDAVRSLTDRAAVDGLVAEIIERGLLPLEYDWSIPRYPALLTRAALLAATRGDLDNTVASHVLDTDRFAITTLLEQVERLGSYGDTERR